MNSLTQNDVNQCVRDAVPHIADHIINKASSNNGFSDNPSAIHPVTKLLTLNLDQATRFSIESELITQSGINEYFAEGQIKFIKSCYSTINYQIVMESVGTEMIEIMWQSLNDDCGRDGCLFLEMISKWDGDMKRVGDRLVEDWSI